MKVHTSIPTTAACIHSYFLSILIFNSLTVLYESYSTRISSTQHKYFGRIISDMHGRVMKIARMMTVPYALCFQLAPSTTDLCSSPLLCRYSCWESSLLWVIKVPNRCRLENKKIKTLSTPDKNVTWPVKSPVDSHADKKIDLYQYAWTRITWVIPADLAFICACLGWIYLNANWFAANPSEQIEI